MAVLSSLAQAGPRADPRPAVTPGSLSDLANLSLASPKVPIALQNVEIKPHFFERGGSFEKISPIIGAVLDSISSMSGAQPSYQIGMARTRQNIDADVDRRLKVAQAAEYLRKSRQPQIEHVGNSIGTLENGQFNPIYTAPTPEERYAGNLGLEAGTDGYRSAIQDYVLRGSGPTAHDYDLDLEGVRQDNREEIENLRWQGRADLRGVPTYGQTHPKPPAPHAPTPNSVIGGIVGKFTDGQALNPQEATVLNGYFARGGRTGRPTAPITGGPAVVAAPGGRSGPTPETAAPVRVQTPAEALRLKPGTRFMTPDGRVKVRP